MVQMLKISVDFEIQKLIFLGLNEVQNSILFIKKFTIYSKMIIFLWYDWYQYHSIKNSIIKSADRGRGVIFLKESTLIFLTLLLFWGRGLYGSDVKNKCWFWSSKIDFFAWTKCKTLYFSSKNYLFTAKWSFFVWYDWYQ